MTKWLSLRAILAILLFSPGARAAVLVATSCEEEAVQASLNAAGNGDTVEVPAGTCEWTTQVVMGSTKGVTLKGAGIDLTTIVDKLSKSGTIRPALQINSNLNGLHRVTGFTFNGATQLGTGGPGFLQVSGFGNNPPVRIDHNKFYRLKTFAITTTSSAIGVIDHNTFDLAYNNAIRNYHSTWQGIGSAGHHSWAQPHSLGTDQAIFMEDNTFTWTGPPQSIQAAIDPHTGARVVFRYNTLTNGYLASHGTEAQANRAPRQWEVYNNTLSGNTFTNFFIRGGPGVVFNNTSSGYPSGPIIETYRYFDDGGPPYGFCDGRNVYDDNAPGGPFETGTVTSASGYTFTDTTKTWTTAPFQWTGYSVRNVTKSRSGGVSSHTSNSITVVTPSNDTAWSFSVGDSYQLWKPTQCLDMAGMGQGDARTGGGTSAVLPAEWNNAIIEGLYFWNNTMNGSAETIVIRRPALTKLNTHIFTSARPGYTPYTYPHPLVIPPPEPEPEQQLLAYWPLNDGAGSSIAADNTAGGNDGTLVGLNTSTAWSGGRHGGGLTFNGAGYVDFGDIPALDFGPAQDFTVLVWVTTTTPLAASYPQMVQKMDDGHTVGWELIRASTSDSCVPACSTWYGSIRIGGVAHVVASTTPLADGRWHLIGLQRDGTTMRTYQDGVMVGELTDPLLAEAVATTFPLRFGRSNFAALPYYFTGTLDEVQIYDYALSLEEIREKFGVHRVRRSGRVRNVGGGTRQ